MHEYSLRCPGCHACEPQHLWDLGPLRPWVSSGANADRRCSVLGPRDPPVPCLHRGRRTGGAPPGVGLPAGAIEPDGRDGSTREQRRSFEPAGMEADPGASDRSFHRRVAAGSRCPSGRRNLRAHYEEHRGAAGQRALHRDPSDGRHTGSSEQFVEFWSSRHEVRQTWFSLFTP